LESKWLNFFCNLFNSSVGRSSISHNTVVIIKVDQLISVLHNSCIVLSEKFFGDALKIGHEIYQV
jgi:hypothetical protein